MAAELEEYLLDVESPVWWRRFGVLPAVGLLAVVLGVVAYLTLLRNGEDAAPAAQTATVQRGAVTNSVSLTGVVAAQQTGQLSFETAGTVSAVYVKLGQEVRAGDVLAEIDATTAQDAVRQAELNLRSAQIRLNDLFQGSSTASDKASAEQAVVQAQATLDKAKEEVEALRHGVKEADRAAAIQARAGAVAQLAQAEASREKLTNSGTQPRLSEVMAADASVNTARLALDAADKKIHDLDNNWAATFRAAESAAQAAAAGLTAAEARRTDAYAGAKQTDVSLQRTQVELAQLSLDKARADLTKTKLVAPFDGVVAALNIQPGDRASTGTGTASTVPITLNTPNALRVDLTVAESDLHKLLVGQRGVVTVSAVEGASFPIEIDSIGSLPTTSQGVVTYQARARLLLDEAPSGAMAGGAAARRAAQAAQADQPASAARARPAPGMQGQVTILIEQRQGVLTVPQRAVAQDGTDSVVRVQRDDGSVETVKVRTGLSSSTVTEIVEGLEEGQRVILPQTSTTASTGTGVGAGNRTGGPVFIGPGGGGGGIPGGVR